MAASAWYEYQKALESRLAGDATMLALLGAGTNSLHNTFSRVGTSGDFPYIVYRIDSIAPLDAFRTNIDQVDFTVLIRVEVGKTYGSDDWMTRMDLIVKRIKGDWDEQSVGTAPTYGLDRWAPGALASTAFTGGMVVRTLGPMTVQEDDVFAQALSFKGHLAKAGA